MTEKSPYVSLRVEDDREVHSFYGPRISGEPRRRSRLRRPLVAVLAIVVIMGMALGSLVAISGTRHSQEQMASPLYTVHSPIRITGNAAFTPANGVTGGAGTDASPYMIQGWDINAKTQAGIVVEQTTAHFMIKNVNVHSGNITSVGITLNHVSNATVSDSILVNNSVGIQILQSNGTSLENNTLQRNIVAGIEVSHCTKVEVNHNIMVQNLAQGIDIDNSTWVQIENNAVTKSIVGLNMMHASNCTVNENSLVNNSIGALMQITNNTVFSENLVMKSGATGIVLFNHCRNDTFKENSVRNSTGLAVIVDISASKNKFLNNNFQNNTVHPQATDNNKTNMWNSSYPTGGNFWSDYTGVDLMSGPGQNLAGSDGIGDTPYMLGGVGMAMDKYPLMRPIALNLGPVPFFTFQERQTNGLEVDFDASMSWDPNDASELLEYRWDYTGLGYYTAWSPTPKTTYTYALPGNYSATLQVKDPAGHISTSVLTVSVQAVVIPEFSSLIAPVWAGVVLFFVLGRLRKDRTERP